MTWRSSTDPIGSIRVQVKQMYAEYQLRLAVLVEDAASPPSRVVPPTPSKTSSSARTPELPPEVKAQMELARANGEPQLDKWTAATKSYKALHRDRDHGLDD